jgi:putative endopeptidase
MAIALEALNDILQKKNASTAVTKKAYRDFFTSYAISWRNKDRPKKAREALYTDSHAPAKFRVNKIVCQFSEFFEAFDIGENDPGWVAPKDRITMW